MENDQRSNAHIEAAPHKQAGASKVKAIVWTWTKDKSLGPAIL